MAKDTKVRIIDAALTLFAQKGYDATSMSEIANQVGIKAPSLYAHFQNKQDLFDSLVERMRDYFGKTYPSLHTPTGSLEAEAKALSGNVTLVKELSIRTFQFYFKDKYAGTFRKVLSIERYHNSQMDKVYCELYLEAPIENQTEIFEELLRQGKVCKDVNPRMAAMEFFAPFIFLMYQYDGQPEQESKAIEELEKHVEQFMKRYFNSV